MFLATWHLPLQESIPCNRCPPRPRRHLPERKLDSITAAIAQKDSQLAASYNAQSHPILFQIGGAPIKRSVSGPREDAVGTMVEDDEPIGDDLSEAEEETTAEQDLQEIKKYIKEAPKKKKAAVASGSGRGTSKKLKTKK